MGEDPVFYALPPGAVLDWCSACGASVSPQGIDAHRRYHQGQAALAAAVAALGVAPPAMPSGPEPG